MLDDLALSRLLDEVARVQKLIDDHDFDQAHALAVCLAPKLQRAGVRSSYFRWLSAVAADYEGDQPLALTNIMEAIVMDPLNPAFRHSKHVIAKKLREVLCADDRALDDPTTRGLWEMLVRAGEADDHCHLVMARFQLATGNVKAALKLIDAVVTLAPENEAAWTLMVAVALQDNDLELAATAKVQALALGARSSMTGRLPSAAA